MEDSNIKSKFKIGDIVSLKSHPLTFQENGLIDLTINHIPPFMCVKEIHFERKKKKYSAEFAGKQVADSTKYLCVYFNQYRMEFEEKFIYEGMLLKLVTDNFKFHRKYDKPFDEEYKKLIVETNELNEAEYIYGKKVFFRTHKLEKRKKFAEKNIDTKSSKKSAVVHTSPVFVLSGIKDNDEKSIYDEKNGKPIKITADKLYRVLWYNSYQEKMSQEYMPKEFFTDLENLYSISDKNDNDKENNNKSETEKESNNDEK